MLKPLEELWLKQNSHSEPRWLFASLQLSAAPCAYTQRGQDWISEREHSFVEGKFTQKSSSPVFVTI